MESVHTVRGFKVWPIKNNKTGPLKVSMGRAVLSNNQRECSRFTLSFEFTVKNTSNHIVSLAVASPILKIGKKEEEIFHFLMPSPPEMDLLPKEKRIISARATENSGRIIVRKVVRACFDMIVNWNKERRRRQYCLKPEVEINNCSIS
jgi:hypothetical protein